VQKPRLTAAEVEAARTLNGGWTKATLAGWGVAWPPPRGWKRRLPDADRAQHPTNNPVVTLRSAVMDTALIAAGAALAGALVTGVLGYLQARLNARSQLLQANLVADREEERHRYEQGSSAFAEYLAVATHMYDVILVAAERVFADHRRLSSDQMIKEIRTELGASPEFKRWQALAMQVLLIIEPDEEEVLTKFETDVIGLAARNGVTGETKPNVGDLTGPLVEVMRRHLTWRRVHGKVTVGGITVEGASS
jgi:hypothetical protein